MLRRAAGLRRQQVARADLHRTCAERERRRDAAPVGTRTASTICGSNANRPGCAWMSSVREHPAMAARLRALRDDRVDAARIEPARFLDGRRGRHHHAPVCARARAAHHPATRNGSSRRPGAVPRRPRTSHRRTARGWAALHVGRIETGFRVITGERRTPVCLDFGVGAGGVAEEVHVERRACACTNRRDLVAQLLQAERRASEPAGFAHRDRERPANRPSAPGSAASGKAASSSESSSGKKVVARAGCALRARY